MTTTSYSLLVPPNRRSARNASESCRRNTTPPSPWTKSGSSRALPQIPKPASQTQTPSPLAKPDQPAAPRFRRAVGLPPRPRLSVVNLTPVEEKVGSPSDTATLVTSPQSGSGTPMTGKAW